MKERPILFSAPMVRALLDGNKTQTRRVVKVESTMGRDSILAPHKGRKYAATYLLPDHASDATACSPYGQPGDRLWVREKWAAPHSQDGMKPGHMYIDESFIHYAASEPLGGLLWRPSIHMPRWASRILLEITSVRAERLQAINEVDAIAEGAPWAACGSPQEGSHKAGYAQLWEAINGPDSWQANPWVWVIEFKKVNP